MNDTRKNMLIRWVMICLIPIITIAIIQIIHPDHIGYLIGGIILACEAVFLFKFILFEVIKHHLKNELNLKKQTMWLFIPIVLLVIYLFYYFQVF